MFRLLRQLDVAPDASQRATAGAIGVSLGRLNALLRSAADSGMITVSDRDAQPLVRIPPIFPPRFLQGDNSGYCKVRFDVSPEGQPFNVVTTRCTSRMLESATKKSVQKWKYNPKIVDGRPTSRSGVESTIRFDLQDERGRKLPLPSGY